MEIRDLKPKNPVLTTDRLTLRPFEEGDREAMVALLCNEEIKETFMIPDFASRAEADTLFDKLSAFSRSDAHFDYAVCLGDTLVGFLDDCGGEDDSVELGYVIDPRYRGRGYAPEALRAAIEELFRMGCPCVTAGYFEENDASRRVMEKCGMVPTDEEEIISYRGRDHRCLYREIRKPDKPEG